MGVAESGKALEWKLVIGTFGFLKADHVGICGLEKFCDQIDAQSHRIDVPGRDRKFHARQEIRRDQDTTMLVMNRQYAFVLASSPLSPSLGRLAGSQDVQALPVSIEFCSRR